jgi:cobalt/nickel transport protein
MKHYRPFWIALVAMALASPIGLYLPEVLRAGTAWGEWSVEEVQRLVGYTPSGMEKLAEFWRAPMPDYALPGQGEAPLARRGLSYILSAVVGIGLCGTTAYVLTAWLTRRKG